MLAIRVQSHTADKSKPYSATNPAPPSALGVDQDVPIPEPTKSGELLVRVKAASVIRDTLTWPEMYQKPYGIPGHDFAGTVESVFPGDETSPFKPGDEVFGMVDANRGETWAEYAIAYANEAARKPSYLSWAEASSIPLSALTAYQALFKKAGLPAPELPSSEGEKLNKHDHASKKRVLITGASGGVGLFLLQLSALAQHHTVAVTSSKSRNKDFLQALGASECLEYTDLENSPPECDVVIDTVGGDVLRRCWSWMALTGSLVTIDSASVNFVDEHKKLGLVQGKETIKAIFFIVEPRREDLDFISRAFDRELLKCFVSAEYPLVEARQAYEVCSGRSTARGKIILDI